MMCLLEMRVEECMKETLHYQRTELMSFAVG